MLCVHTSCNQCSDILEAVLLGSLSHGHVYCTSVLTTTTLHHPVCSCLSKMFICLCFVRCKELTSDGHNVCCFALHPRDHKPRWLNSHVFPRTADPDEASYGTAALSNRESYSRKRSPQAARAAHWLIKNTRWNIAAINPSCTWLPSNERVELPGREKKWRKGFYPFQRNALIQSWKFFLVKYFLLLPSIIQRLFNFPPFSRYIFQFLI